MTGWQVACLVESCVGCSWVVRWRDAVEESERVNEIANNNNNKAPTTTTSSLCTLSHTQKPTATASGSSSPYCMNALLPDLFARPPPLAGL